MFSSITACFDTYAVKIINSNCKVIVVRLTWVAKVPKVKPSEETCLEDPPPPAEQMVRSSYPFWQKYPFWGFLEVSPCITDRFLV